MGTANSRAFDVQVVDPSGTVSQVGDATPPLMQLIALDNAKWVLDVATSKITRNGVDTRQPYSIVRVLYINLRDAAWLQSSGQPDAIWLKDSATRYAWYNHSTGVWGFAGHGPDQGKF